MQRSKAPAGGLLFALLVLPAGCLNTHTGLVPRNARPETVGAQGADQVETRYGWSRISIGALPRPKPYGFLRTQRLTRGDPGGSEDEVREARWLYDRDWNLVGCVSPRGATMRYDERGRSELLGNMELDDAVRAVYDVRTRDEVHYAKMPAPRS